MRPLFVQLIPQPSRTLKPDYPPLTQHQILPGPRVPPSPFPFIFHIEFPKATDQNILAALQGLFNDLQEGVNQLGGFGFGEPDLAVDGLAKICLDEGHGSVVLLDISLVALKTVVLRPLLSGSLLTSRQSLDVVVQYLTVPFSHFTELDTHSGWPLLGFALFSCPY